MPSSTGSLLVVTGPPGAGKSTVAELVVQRLEPSILVEGDWFFDALRRGAIAPWLPESNEQNTVVTRAGAAAAGQYATGGFHTVYEGILGPWFLPTFAAATGLDTFDYVVLLPSADRCIEGVTTRRGHTFSDEDATRKMHTEFAGAAIDERHVLIDPPDGADAVADDVLERRATGALTFRTGSAVS